MKVGFVGWRGMVGSVLMQRMHQEDDFVHFKPTFFSTSNAGGQSQVQSKLYVLRDAKSIEQLGEMDIIVTCQGGDYTSEIHPKLRGKGWGGYWIDAASTLRMADNSVIVLDPVNRDLIGKSIDQGIRDYVGGNCTVSLMLMGLGGLYQTGLVEWMSAMTYQAASGAGAKNMQELLKQMGVLHASCEALLSNPSSGILEIERQVTQKMHAKDFPQDCFGAPLAGNLIPWIDTDQPNGQTREEWKGQAETNKILGLVQNPIAIDGICVRIGALRSHSQALTFKLKENLPLNEIENLIKTYNTWIDWVPNNKSDTLKRLTPSAITGTLNIAVGRVRKMNMGEQYLTAFTVGDQLLWGAAEPLRRALRLILKQEL